MSEQAGNEALLHSAVHMICFLSQAWKGQASRLSAACSDPAADAKEFATTGAQVLVGTPGRLLDIMQRSSLMSLKRFEVLVLDEADRLLDMGFKVQLDSIMKMLPKQRRTGLSNEATPHVT